MYIYCGRKKTNKLQVHSYKPVSRLPYNSSSKRSNICLREQFLIICRPELLTLNKRNELVSSCRHRNKALLRNN